MIKGTLFHNNGNGITLVTVTLQFSRAWTKRKKNVSFVLKYR
jgi:hypothetical protein